MAPHLRPDHAPLPAMPSDLGTIEDAEDRRREDGLQAAMQQRQS
jgi:hypothetical protein